MVSVRTCQCVMYVSEGCLRVCVWRGGGGGGGGGQNWWRRRGELHELLVLHNTKGINCNCKNENTSIHIILLVVTETVLSVIILSEFSLI